MLMRDSGEEVVISWDADGHVLDSGHVVEYEGEQTYSTTAEEAMIKHYEDFHVFLYGVVPLVIALVITYLGYKWFSDTFFR